MRSRYHKVSFILDHKPLLSLSNESKVIQQQAANRIQRWAWMLALYEYTYDSARYR